MFIFFNDTATTEIYSLSLHDALPILEQIIMGVHFKDEEWFSRYDENTDGLYEVVHVADKYSMGEEKTLIKNIFYEDKEKWVPRRVELPDGNKRPGLPLDRSEEHTSELQSRQYL